MFWWREAERLPVTRECVCVSWQASRRSGKRGRSSTPATFTGRGIPSQWVRSSTPQTPLLRAPRPTMRPDRWAAKYPGHWSRSYQNYASMLTYKTPERIMYRAFKILVSSCSRKINHQMFCFYLLQKSSLGPSCHTWHDSGFDPEIPGCNLRPRLQLIACPSWILYWMRKNFRGAVNREKVVTLIGTSHCSVRHMFVIIV